MEKLVVQANPVEADGAFLVAWQWWANKLSPSVAGTLTVPVDGIHTSDRGALAELKALHHLLEHRQIHGAGRLGNGLCLQVSHGCIRKAVAKSALKKSMAGKTDKSEVAQAASFLATKYFEATVEVGSLVEASPKRVEPHEVLASVGRVFDRVTIDCPLLGGPVVVTRHAMHRYVARVDQKRDRFTESDLSGVDDVRWSQAWRWFVRILPHPDLKVATLLPAARKRSEAKYGKNCYYLHFEAAGALLIVRRDGHGLSLATVIRLSPHQPMIAQPDFMVGQKLVKAHVHLARK